MKFNCDKDQVQIVDSGTDVVRVIRNITESGVSIFCLNHFFDSFRSHFIKKYIDFFVSIKAVPPCEIFLERLFSISVALVLFFVIEQDVENLPEKFLKKFSWEVFEIFLF